MWKIFQMSGFNYETLVTANIAGHNDATISCLNSMNINMNILQANVHKLTCTCILKTC